MGPWSIRVHAGGAGNAGEIADRPPQSGERRAIGQLEPPTSLIFSCASSIVKEPGFCAGGNSLNVAMNLATSVCAICMMKPPWSNQSLYVFEVVSARSYGSRRRLKSLG